MVKTERVASTGGQGVVVVHSWFLNFPASPFFLSNFALLESVW